MKTLLMIRFLQIKRELEGAGFRLVLLFGFLCFLVYASYIAYQDRLYASCLIGALIYIIGSLQIYRQDKSFVYLHIPKARFAVFAEYAALTFPFAVTALFTKNWWCYPVLLLTIYGITHLRYTIKQRSYFRQIGRLLPASNFEWISGFRKSFLFLIPVYFLALSFSWFNILPLLLLAFMTITIVSFYEEGESLIVLRARNESTQRFLGFKICSHALCLIVLYAPVLIINVIFNPSYWLIALLFIPVQLALLCFAICLKYATYQPNESNKANSVLLSIVSLSSFIPYLLPIPLLMSVRYYSRAKANLMIYLHD